jgi:hypothetical protein
MYSTISNVVPAFKVVEKTKQMINKEHQPKMVLQRDPLTGATMKQNISGLIGLIFFIGAVYLSWTCNTKCTPQMSPFEKVIRAIFAGMFSFIYLIIYLITWSAQCNSC